LGFRFIYTGIRVKNMDESIRFYTEVLGMTVVEEREKTEPTKGEVVTLKSPNSNQLLELNFYEEESAFYTPYINGEDLDHLAFDVENLESTVLDLKRKGVEIIVEPYQIGGWREAFIKDPNGIWIELLQRK
jgi:lactoylglutathione lyase